MNSPVSSEVRAFGSIEVPPAQGSTGPHVQMRSLDLPVDLRMLDYVNNCDENLICPICRCPFVDPVILTDCDHCFCRDCIRQTWTSVPVNTPSVASIRKECPSCRTPAKLGMRSSTNKILANILDDMLVQCPNAKHGCSAHVKRGDIQDHVTLYCSYAMVECMGNHCERITLRKNLAEGCLHSPVSCAACREQMLVADLDTHWHAECSDRDVICGVCHTRMLQKDLAHHLEQVCPGSGLPCPGKTLGCTHRSKQTLVDQHIQSCPLAALQPIFAAQKQRLDEQEIAQKQMNRRMKILENGFSAMRDIVYPPTMMEQTRPRSSQDATVVSENEGSTARPHRTDHRRAQSSTTFSTGVPAQFDTRSEFEQFPSSPATNGPYTSPLHHLLSVQENLREEMSRISNALQELDGRQSLQILNENIRVREEMSYLGAQLAGLTRQVHWLTSTQLQRQSQNVTSPSSSTGDITTSSHTVEAAVSAVNSAVRGAARMMGGSREGMGSRRGSSEEGRTKL